MKKFLPLALIACFFSLAAFPFDLQKLCRETEESRGLNFKSAVDVKIVSKEEMGKIIAGELEREFPEKEFAAREKALKAFGLISPGTDLRKAMGRLLGGQVAGIYDPKEKKLYVLSEAKAPGDDPLFDLSQAFDVREIFIIHEMAHALADQHFDLVKSLGLDEKGNDDRMAAAMALAEGDATLTMFDAMARRFGLENGDLAAMPDLMDGRSLVGEFLGEDVPKYLAETLLFSYLRGMSFVREAAGGRREALDRIYKNPPASTEQVLHPGKYLKKDDQPRQVTVDDEKLPGAAAIYEGTWGEFATGLILEEWGADETSSLKASEGWGGDRYVVFERKGGGLSFVWKTLWDTQKDADEFRAALSKNSSVSVSGRGAEVILRSIQVKNKNENAAKGDR